MSSGPENVSVPDVRRRPQSEAEQLLVNRGFAVGTVGTTPSTSFAPGIVVRQDPAPNASRPKGTPVNITVAVAPANVAVQDVIGDRAEDARFKLGAGRFRVTSPPACMTCAVARALSGAALTLPAAWKGGLAITWS